MKKKKITKIMSLIVIFVGLFAVISKLTPKTIKQDGATLALTLDGKLTSSFPDYSSGSYSVNISCENGSGKWLNIDDEWKFVVENLTGNAVCNLDFTSNPTTLKAEVQAKATTNSNGYRYSGKKPNNFIWFNNEMWRIIGSIPVCTSSGCSTSENLVKIIRAQSIGNYSYSISGSDTWHTSSSTKASLYSLLNEYYLGKLNATGTTYCHGNDFSESVSACDFRAKGIETDGYFGKMIKNVYWNTGNSSDLEVTASSMYTTETSQQTSYSYIALMSASDYGYAADSTYHSTTLIKYNTVEITSANWLYGQGQERIFPRFSGNAMEVHYDGSISTSPTLSYIGLAIRPVVYLDSSVYVVDGTGTEADPYIIGMN